MLEHIHRHILDELDTNTKTDRVFVLSAIILNLITLGANSVIALINSTAGYISFVLFLLLVGVVNWVVIRGLNQGKIAREKLLTGLIRMYEDEKIEKYYDTSLLAGYNKRYAMFTVVVVATGTLAFLIPLTLLIFEH